MGGAPALAGHNTACGGVFSGVVSKIFAVKKKKKEMKRPRHSRGVMDLRRLELYV